MAHASINVDHGDASAGPAPVPAHVRAADQNEGASSSPPSVPSTAFDRQAYLTVRELMRLESEQALAAARERRHRGQGVSSELGESVSRGSPTVAAESLRLVGIYGVGKRLFAEVRSGSNAWLFLNGHRLPVGHTAGAQSYRLKEVAGACVRLERDGSETVLCLPRGGRQ